MAWWELPCVLPFLICCFKYCIYVFYFCQFDYYVSQCIPPWLYSASDSLCFLDLVDYLLSNAREVFSYYLLQYLLQSFLSPPVGPYNVNAVPFSVVPDTS